MLEALIKNRLEQDGQSGNITVESAGLLHVAARGWPVCDNTLNCMAVIGIDVRAHRSRWIGNIKLSDYGTIICMDREILGAVRASAVNSTRARIVLLNEPDGIESLAAAGRRVFPMCVRRMDELISGLISPAAV